MKKNPYSPHVTSRGTNDHRFSKKNIVETRILCLHIRFLIRGIRWKTNCVGPLGPRWRKSNMAAMKQSPAFNMIIHIIGSTRVVPPNVNTHN